MRALLTNVNKKGSVSMSDFSVGEKERIEVLFFEQTSANVLSRVIAFIVTGGELSKGKLHYFSKDRMIFSIPEHFRAEVIKGQIEQIIKDEGLTRFVVHLSKGQAPSLHFSESQVFVCA